MIRNSLTLAAFLALVLAIHYALAQIPGATPIAGLVALFLFILWRPLWVKYGRGRL